MHKDLERVLITKEELSARVREMGQQIARDYADKNPVLVGILKGAVVFYSDLCREIECDMQMDFMVCSSYGGGTRTSGEVEIRKDISVPVAGRHVIIVEDIIDSGNTLSYLKRVFKDRGVASFKIATLLDKPDRRAPSSIITVDYRGFTIPDEFVVGYGLDYDEKYRNLPCVGVLRRDIYENN